MLELCPTSYLASIIFCFLT